MSIFKINEMEKIIATYHEQNVDGHDSNGNPSRIYFMNGYMTTYTYSATGQKLAVEHSVALPNVTWAFGVEPDLSQHTAIFAGHTDYLLGGTLVVQEGTTKKLLFDGGYAKAERASPNSVTYGYTLSYYNKDHLGNNRAVVNQSGTIEQITHYYPFGGIIADLSSGQDVQPYKYNGKELDRMHGLDWYDYGARNYDAAIGSWPTVDPLCEKYYSLSPYNYCGNNPVKFVDVKGEKIVDPNGKVVRITWNSNNSLVFSNNANPNIIRVANAMNLTKTGRHQLHNLIQSDIKVTIDLSDATKGNGHSYTYGETIQGNNNRKNNYGTYYKNGKFGITEAHITIFLGSIKKALQLVLVSN